jgi:S-adenosyl methyltransferase
VDFDPLVPAHARALLTSSPEGVTQYVDADGRDSVKELREEFARFFDGLELIEPGVTLAPLWRPASEDAQPLDVVCGVGRTA